MHFVLLVETMENQTKLQQMKTHNIYPKMKYLLSNYYNTSNQFHKRIPYTILDKKMTWGSHVKTNHFVRTTETTLPLFPSPQFEVNTYTYLLEPVPTYSS